MMSYKKEMSFTSHAADATITFAELEVRGVEDLKGDLLTVAAAFVHHFLTHGCATINFAGYMCIRKVGRRITPMYAGKYYSDSPGNAHPWEMHT